MVSDNGLAMTVVGERFRRAGQEARDLYDRPAGDRLRRRRARRLAAARIAGSLARWLGSRVLLATVQQPTPRTPNGVDLTPVAIRHGRTLLERAVRVLDECAEMRVLLGEPAERLRAAGAAGGAELIVVAAPRAVAHEDAASRERLYGLIQPTA